MTESSFLLVVFATALLIIPTFSLGKHSRPKLKSENKVAIFVFGDSVFDVGNNNYLNIGIEGKANFPPYGETFFRQPTGRFCDGRTIPDYAASYANIPYWKPFLDTSYQNFTNGANFASAGGTVIPGDNPITLNFGTQVGYLQQVANLLNETLGHTEAQKILRNGIYFSSFGGVDYMYYTSENENATESEQLEFVTTVIGNFTYWIEEIYQKGGRKFAFQNVGPLGCQPEMKQSYNLTGKECYEFVQTLATLHNNALSNMAIELERKLSGFTYLIFDFFTTLNDRIQDPAKYGFKESNIACCGTGTNRGTGCGRTTAYELCSDPNEYVFFDGGHPTESCYSELGELLWNGTSDVTWPLNMKQLYELEIYSADDGHFIDHKVIASSLISHQDIASY
ncbi:Lipase_GDSL domain-containing protein [Cephalotus follicularis]|uniref:Lipase_GDSL domain-containing protein n=1 Tax=Cephalotus follicularis TaxID=3775 RepID=A0A1Q3B088_CEPFO|nr:Lipase_GDSL domain-containing protein [Cephalotus follicularis]